MSTASTTQTCDIVLPGYTLADRIGAGGYAEVWRAEAPGGIQKAVKIVYGYYDDEFASQELKALERIKGVRHPFLLSLERFEVINGRLAILTELADMSLDQRLRQCRTEGLPGIPREELLRYMADTAEALDFLSQRHSLLHLDIKPENLLVLGDHIKVADFGLVKELASRTQNSLVSGMTPTYAAPEMFDDDPTAHSDQYSLAIVYQEMLVGTLPFPGRTAAQLAKQHMQAEPQLMTLPAADRPIVARALAKKPEERFPSCRAFIDTLMGRVAPPTSSPRPSTDLPSAVPAEADTKPPSFSATIRRPEGQSFREVETNHTQPVSRGVSSAVPVANPTLAREKAPVELPPEPAVPEETNDIGVPEAAVELRCEQPTLFVALGGVGIQSLCRYRTLTADSEAAESDAVEMIALDTDRDELREATASRWKSPLAHEDTLHLPLRLPKSYDNSREILTWVSKRWLYNIPRSLETRGYRPLGRVALVDHSLRVLALLDQKLQRLAAVAGTANASGETRDAKIRVVVLAGMGGGTGAGMSIDVATAVKSLAAARGIQVEVQGFMICTCFASASGSPLLAANTYSLLTELNHAMAYGNASMSGQPTQAGSFESDGAPFDSLYCVPTRPRKPGVQGDDALDTVAKYLALETLPETRAALRACRGSQTPREQARGRATSIKKLGYASFGERQREAIGALANELAEAIKRHWLSKDVSADWERLVAAEELAAKTPKLVTPAEGGAEAVPVVLPVNDTTPLALRGRFKEQMSLEFVSEVLRSIERQLAARDDHGRPLLIAKETKLIADTASARIASLAAHLDRVSASGLRFASSPMLRVLVAAGSQHVIQHAIEKFDAKQTERFLPLDSLDELLQATSRTLLEGAMAQPELAAALSGMIALDEALAETMQHASADLLQCGSDRRTIVVVPKDQISSAVVEKLRSQRPQAVIVAADVDDVLVVSEESGVSPRSFALGLERVFPGIADAARRLLTRIDIEWKSLV